MDIDKWLRDERYDVCDRNMRCNGEVMEEAADEIERLRKALHHCVEALAEFEKDSNLPIEQFQHNVVFELKGYLLGALDNARLATGEK